MVRFGRWATGCRKASAIDQRRPRRLVDVKVRTAGVVTAVELVDRGDAHLRRRLPARRPESSSAPEAVRRESHHRRRATRRSRRSSPPAPGRSPASRRTVRATPAPTLVTGRLRPQVVIGGLAAHVDHRVDRRAAADHAAPRVVNAAAGQTRVGLRCEAPVGAGVGDRVQVAHGHFDPEPVVRAAGLDQEHPAVGIGAEPVRQQAARTTCSHDNEIEFGWADDGIHLPP